MKYRPLKISIHYILILALILVLGLSLSYIPLNKIAYSLLTVILSGQIIGLFQKNSQ